MLGCVPIKKMNKSWAITLGGKNTLLNHINIKALSLAMHSALPNNQRAKNCLKINCCSWWEASFTDRSHGPIMSGMQVDQIGCRYPTDFKGAACDSNSNSFCNSLQLNLYLKRLIYSFLLKRIGLSYIHTGPMEFISFADSVRVAN